MNNLLAGGNTTTITNPIFSGTIFANMISDPSGGSFFLSKAIPSLVGLVFVVGGVVFFFMIIWGAVGWILSGGDKASLEGAKNKITNAIIGFVLLIGSYAIVKLLEAFFGIDILLIDIGSLVIQ